MGGPLQAGADAVGPWRNWVGYWLRGSQDTETSGQVTAQSRRKQGQVNPWEHMEVGMAAGPLPAVEVTVHGAPSA